MWPTPALIWFSSYNLVPDQHLHQMLDKTRLEPWVRFRIHKAKLGKDTADTRNLA